MQLLFRFLVGGLVVSFFALLGDGLKPKSFAGLFGAAPSVALATVGLTIQVDGKNYAASEARSMIVGACAFLAYSFVCTRVLAKAGLPAVAVTVSGLALWFAAALGGWLLFLR